MDVHQILGVESWSRAGHRVAILLKIYAKCIDGQDHINRRRIEDTLSGFEAPDNGDPDCKPEGAG